MKTILEKANKEFLGALIAIYEAFSSTMLIACIGLMGYMAAVISFIIWLAPTSFLGISASMILAVLSFIYVFLVLTEWREWMRVRNRK